MRRSQGTTSPDLTAQPAPGQRPDQKAASPAAAPVSVSPLRARRRPALIALAVALIALGAGTGAWLLSRSGESVSVLVLADTVARGEVIEASDLTATELPVGTVNLDAVPYSDLDQVVGQVATADMVPGSLLGPNAFASELVPAQGDSVVGVALTPAQMPSVGVAGGDTVRFVATPQQGGEMPVGDPPTITAQVINVASTESGFLVNVQVPSGQAPTLAAMAATSRIALILDPVD